MKNKTIMGVKMHDVKSTHIESIGYDGENLELLVKFKDRVKKDGTEVRGSVTKYKKIAGRHFDGMKAADSAGKYLNAEIKPNYEHTTYKAEERWNE